METFFHRRDPGGRRESAFVLMEDSAFSACPGVMWTFAVTMRLKVNGEEYITERDTLGQLLKELEIVPERVAVEVNLMVIKRKDFENHRLKDSDSVEIVYFVGGGRCSVSVCEQKR